MVQCPLYMHGLLLECRDEQHDLVCRSNGLQVVSIDGEVSLHHHCHADLDLFSFYIHVIIIIATAAFLWETCVEELNRVPRVLDG